jgi:hypothetical protein
MRKRISLGPLAPGTLESLSYQFSGFKESACLPTGWGSRVQVMKKIISLGPSTPGILESFLFTKCNKLWVLYPARAAFDIGFYI